MFYSMHPLFRDRSQRAVIGQSLSEKAVDGYRLASYCTSRNMRDGVLALFLHITLIEGGIESGHNMLEQP